MPVVTITSDFGSKDYYLAGIKGALLCEEEQLSIIDISHNVAPYDIVQAAFILNNAYENFPKGTIHIMSVHNFYQHDICFLALRQNDHYFIGPDNGVFALMFDGGPELVIELELEDQSFNGLKQLYAKAVKHLVSGRPINELGVHILEVSEAITIHPVIHPDRIQGTIIYVDHFGNCMLNVEKKLFDNVRGKRKFKLFYKRADPITKLSTQYTDVPFGEILCLFNSAGYLEIAINAGQAASMLDLKKDDTVQIDFL